MHGNTDVNDVTISEWSEMFADLYKEADKRRKPEEYWAAVMAHLSSIGEAIRRTDYPGLAYSAAHAFCWLASYVNYCNKTDDIVFRMNHGLSEIIAMKFPDVCGHCRNNHCSCKAYETDQKEDKSAKYNDLLGLWINHQTSWPTRTIRKWLDIFWGIYEGQIHIQTIENIGFHLLEEAGEEAKALRQLVQFRGILGAGIEGIDEAFLNKLVEWPSLVGEYNQIIKQLKERAGVADETEAKKIIESKSDDPEILKSRLVLSKVDFIIELADTFSWFCAVLLKMEKTLEPLGLEIKNSHTIEKALEDRYKYQGNDKPLTCYACGETSCQCRFYPE